MRVVLSGCKISQGVRHEENIERERHERVKINLGERPNNL